MRIRALLVILLLVAFVVVGCGESGNTSSSNDNTETEEQEEEQEEKEEEEQESQESDLTLLESEAVVGDYGNRYIQGTIKNNSTEEYDYVEVEAVLYNDEGVQVGDTFTNTTNLSSGGKWKFEMTILQEDATQYEIVDVSGDIY